MIVEKGFDVGLVFLFVKMIRIFGKFGLLFFFLVNSFFVVVIRVLFVKVWLLRMMEILVKKLCIVLLLYSLLFVKLLRILGFLLKVIILVCVVFGLMFNVVMSLRRKFLSSKKFGIFRLLVLFIINVMFIFFEFL